MNSTKIPEVITQAHDEQIFICNIMEASPGNPWLQNHIVLAKLRQWYIIASEKQGI